MEIKLSVNYTIEMKECDIDSLTAAFKVLLMHVFTDLVIQTLRQFADEAMARTIKPFSCDCGNEVNFIWKTRDAKSTLVRTLYGVLTLPQMQVQCKKCGKKIFITRLLLNIVKYRSMSSTTEKILAYMGSLGSFRVCGKILSVFGLSFDRTAVWRCVQKVGKTITFDIDPDELGEAEADGTGIPIQWIKKRGRELKVFVQKKRSGGIRIAGLSIGPYDSGWDKLFAPLIEGIKAFKRFLLATDGDTSILKGLNCDVLFQRCLWHIPHQLKHCLWSDGVQRKSERWLEVLGKIFDITATRPHMEEEDIAAVIQEKENRLERLIELCQELGFKASAAYLRNAAPHMFVSLENRLSGKSTSLVERVMRTVNLRVNVGKWTPSGALNAMNIRLAHYYNGWEPPVVDSSQIVVKRL